MSVEILISLQRSDIQSYRHSLTVRNLSFSTGSVIATGSTSSSCAGGLAVPAGIMGNFRDSRTSLVLPQNNSVLSSVLPQYLAQY